MTMNVTNEKRPNPAFPIITTLAGGVVGGLLIGKKESLTFDTDKILTADKFELSEDMAKKLSDENKNVVAEINDNLQTFKNAGSVAESKTNELFKGKETLSVPEFLKAQTEETPQKGFKTFLSNLFGTKLTPEKAMENCENGIKKLNETLDESLKKLESSPEDAKKAMQEDIKKLTSKIEAEKSKLDFVKTAKDGKITKEAFKENMANSIGDAAKTAITKSIESLKEFSQKVPSMGKAAIGAAVGLVAGLIVANIATNKANSVQKQSVA